MELIYLIQTKVINPVGMSLQAFYLDVLVPFWNTLTTWIEEYLPWCQSFADLVSTLFKLKYKGRIYGCMLLVPVLFLLLVISTVRTRIRIRRRRKKYAARH